MDELFIAHPGTDLALDLTRTGLRPEQLDALDWSTAFAEMEALEQGAIANVDEGRQVGHFWLRAPERAPSIPLGQVIGTTRDAVLTFAADVREGRIQAPIGEPFTDVLHVGIGGSALGPQLLVDALGGDGLSLHFVDNLDPDGIARTLAALRPRLATTLVVGVSKSGGTPETAHGLTLARRALEAAGLDAPRHLVAVTGEGSRLDEVAVNEGWLARFAMWDWVGGRMSVTSAVGLLPGALAGIDMRAVLEGAAAMDAWTRATVWRDNPAALLAGSWHALGNGRGDRAMVVLPYNDRLLLFSRYLQQLVMESLGKAHDRQGNRVEQGIAVYGNKGSTDQHSFVQQLRDGRNDFMAVLIDVLGDGAGSLEPVEGEANAGDFLQGFLLGTRRALADNDRPVITIAVPRVDEAVLGGLIALFERAVGLYATLIDINAYHQPGVEAGKKAAREILDLQATLRDALTDSPQLIETLAELAGTDSVEAWFVLKRLAHTGRATCTREGWTS